jgi:transcriptional regulator with XRE-family HTH domain
MKQLIKDAGYGQNAFAELMNISSSKMSFWCNAEYPPLEAIELVCATLKIPLYKFFLTESDMVELSGGVNPRWAEIGKLAEQLPEEIQILIVDNFLSVLKMVRESMKK